MRETLRLFDAPARQLVRPRGKKGTPKASPEDLFDFHVRAHKLPDFERKYRFAKSVGRQFEFDFACMQYMLAVEVEGLVVNRVNGELIVRGRHASITGFRDDCVKYAIAAMLGWTVLRFEQSQVRDGLAIDYTIRVLAAKGWRRPAEEKPL